MRARILVRLLLAVVVAGTLLAGVILSYAIAPGVAISGLLQRADMNSAAEVEKPLASNTQILAADVESDIGTATRANIPGHDIAGKTGTTENNFSVAFVGSTPRYTASVMVENPNAAQDVGGFGGDKGAQIWHDAMAPILAAGPTDSFPPADAQYLGSLARSTGSGCSFQVGNLQLPC